MDLRYPQYVKLVCQNVLENLHKKVSTNLKKFNHIIKYLKMTV